MELLDVLRTTGAVRAFTDEPVDDATLHRILDTARFAPSGGNRQGWRVVVVQDPERRRALRDLYAGVWREYLAQRLAGLTPWAPVTDRQAEAAALAGVDPDGGVDDFTARFDEAPALLAVCVDLRALAAVDRDLDRYTFAGGASVYPFCWSVLLAARAEGLGGVLTTMAINREPEVRAVLDLPEEVALAAIVVLGQPVRQVRRLARDPVEAFTTVDSLHGSPFGA